MQLAAYQQQARRTMRPGLTPRDALLDSAAGLSEEAGEVLSHVRKHTFFEQPLDRDAVREELGDALWCLGAVATCLVLSLGDGAESTLIKINKKGVGG